MICPTCKKEVEITKRETDEFGRVVNYFSCGHRLLEVAIQNFIQPYSIASIKKKGPEKFSKKNKFEYEQLIGKRFGKDGRLVFIDRIINRVKDSYKEFVKEGNKIIRDFEGKLSDHK
jgi:hypothetical protein